MADCDVLHGAEDFSAVAVAQPAELRKEDTAVGRIEPDLLRIWVAEVARLTLLLEPREGSAFAEEVAVSSFQVL